MPFPWLSRRTARKSRPARRPVRLAVEALEDRLTPSGILTTRGLRTA